MAFQQGLSGLGASAKQLDVISNNVANATTVGFKSAQTHFSDVYAASLSGAGASQVGVGVAVAGIVQQFTQGNISTTNNPLDIGINGGGFFRMDTNGSVSYSRSGQFHLDKDGYVVNDLSAKLTGYPVDAATGVVVPSSPAPILLSSADIAPIATGAGTGALVGVQAKVNLDSRQSATTWASGSALGAGAADAAAAAAAAAAGITSTTVSTAAIAAAVLAGASAPASTAAGSAAAAAFINALANANAVPITPVNAQIAAAVAGAFAATAIDAGAGAGSTAAAAAAAGAVAGNAAAAALAGGATPVAAATAGGAAGAQVTEDIAAAEAFAAAEVVLLGSGAAADAAVRAAFAAAPPLVLPAIPPAGAAAGTAAGAATAAAAAAAVAHAVDPTSWSPKIGTYNYSTAISVYDSLGNPHNLSVYFSKTANSGEWAVHANVDGTTDANVTLTPVPTLLQYDTSGNLSALTANISVDIQLTQVMTDLGKPNNANPTLSFNLDMTGSTQFGATSATNSLAQDGSAAGRLTGISVSADGIVKGNYSNGQSLSLGQVVLATFANPNGLASLGNNQWQDTSASGPPLVGAPNSGRLGVLQSASVEESNVDLTAELVNMITAQRSYQANAQSIKTQDQIMQTLVNLR